MIVREITDLVVVDIRIIITIQQFISQSALAPVDVILIGILLKSHVTIAQ